jgi:hypothetical protein
MANHCYRDILQRTSWLAQSCEGRSHGEPSLTCDSRLRFPLRIPADFFCGPSLSAANRIGRLNRAGNRSSPSDQRFASCLSIACWRVTNRLPYPAVGAIGRQKSPMPSGGPRSQLHWLSWTNAPTSSSWTGEKAGAGDVERQSYRWRMDGDDRFFEGTIQDGRRESGCRVNGASVGIWYWIFRIACLSGMGSRVTIRGR